MHARDYDTDHTSPSAYSPIHCANVGTYKELVTACGERDVDPCSAVKFHADTWRQIVTCEDCRRVLMLCTAEQPSDPLALLERAGILGVQVFTEVGRIVAVCGMYWTQDLIDAIWECEDAILAVMTSPATALTSEGENGEVLSVAEKRRLQFHRWRLSRSGELPAADRVA